MEAGGAETQLAELAARIDKTRFDVSIATFYSGGKRFETVRNTPNVRLFSTNKRGRWDLLGFFLRLCKIFREARPQIVCAYNGANEVTFLMGALFRAKTVLSIRSTFWDTSEYGWQTRLLSHATRAMTYRSALVIAVSEAIKREYVRRGYCEKKMLVLYSGFSVDAYQRNRSLGAPLRAKWGVAPDQFLIGVVARFDPRKDLATFIRAAATLAAQREDVRFVCVGGRGSNAYREEMEALVVALGLQSRFIWAGVQDNMLAVYNALDVSALTSSSEGFPNVLAEAMCCEIPSATTKAGDSATLRGDPNWVVEVRDAEGMAERWSALLAMPAEERAEIGRASREHILANFTSVQFTRKLETVFKDLIGEA